MQENNKSLRAKAVQDIHSKQQYILSGLNIISSKAKDEFMQKMEEFSFNVENILKDNEENDNRI